MNGESANDPYCSGCQYTSPIVSSCDSNFIILLTDGLPTGEDDNSFLGSYVQDYDNDGAEGASSNQNCNNTSSDLCASFMDDAAYFAHTSDFSSTITGTQNIKTFTVGLGIDYDLLDQTAASGGTNSSYFAGSTAELESTLENIITQIVVSSVSGAGAALAETFGDEGRVFRPRYEADLWTGHVDVSHYDSSSGELVFAFDVADILEARNLNSNPRSIVSGYDPDHDGNTDQTLQFNSSNAATLRTELFQLFIDGTLDPALLEPLISDYTQTSSAQTLIDFIKGTDFDGLRIRDRDDDGETDKLGDIVYSRPAEVGPRNGNFSNFLGYNTFTASQQSEPRILLVGANDGMLHAFSSTTGEELWGYIPASQLPYLERLSRLSYNGDWKRAYVDGQITVSDVYRGGSWRTLAMIGLGGGGSSYVVLDVTDRDNPTLLWEVDASVHAGQSWSKPSLVITGGSASDYNPAAFNWYMVVGTGEGKSTAGSNIIAYDLSS